MGHFLCIHWLWTGAKGLNDQKMVHFQALHFQVQFRMLVLYSVMYIENLHAQLVRINNSGHHWE